MRRVDQDRAALRHPLLGWEWDWLATDPSERVALLATGGGGPVPKVVLRLAEQMEAAVEAVCQLPASGEVAQMRRQGGDWTDWANASARGLYAFDWGGWTGDGPYTLVTVPSRPLAVGQLPPGVAAVARLFRFSVEFGDAIALHLPDDV